MKTNQKFSLKDVTPATLRRRLEKLPARLRAPAYEIHRFGVARVTTVPMVPFLIGHTMGSAGINDKDIPALAGALDCCEALLLECRQVADLHLRHMNEFQASIGRAPISWRDLRILGTSLGPVS